MLTTRDQEPRVNRTQGGDKGEVLAGDRAWMIATSVVIAYFKIF